MIDDVLTNFTEWFADDGSLDETTPLEETDLETASLLSIEDLTADELNERTDDYINDLDDIVSEEIAAIEETVTEIESSLELSEELIANSSENGFDNSAEISDFNLSDNFDWIPNWFEPENEWDSSEFDGVGQPAEHSQFWQQQQGQNSCAVVAQIGVFESITGVCIPEDEACEIARANGWFNPETGTLPDDVGKLLNEFGIPTEQKYEAGLEDIADALEKGDRVIVGLDAQEIWNPLRDENGMPIEQTNGGHAVWVTGIDTQPDGSVKLILNDSGNPDGKMASVDAVDFLNAWEDYGNFLVVADAPHETVSV